MKKKVKPSSRLFDKKLNLIFDPNMKELPLSESLSRKIEEVNESFLRSKYKTIEEMIKHANDSSHE